MAAAQKRSIIGITKSEAVRMTGLTDVQVGRRLADLVRDRKLHRTGTTRANTRGFAEAVHYLGPGPETEPEPERTASAVWHVGGARYDGATLSLGEHRYKLTLITP